MDQSGSSAAPVPTTPPLVSLGAFHGIIWGGFALCALAFAGRMAIRVTCFHRLFTEDYLMFLALIVLLTATVIGQLFVHFIYNLEEVSNGATPPPTFLSDTSKGLKSFAALTIINYVGIWLIKLNFLLFFRRLGNHIEKYLYFWWFVVAFNVAAGLTCIGLIDFNCVLPPAEIVFEKCNSVEAVRRSYTAAKASASLDAISDGLIIGFPFWILWGCRLTLRKKLALSGIFGLVAFTIAVTIIRGSIFGGVYQSISEHHKQQLNITWIWFWFNIEFIVAFTVGCLTSFRALFGLKRSEDERRRKYALRPRTKSSDPRGLRAKARRLQEQLTITFMTWEATTMDGDEDEFNLPRPPTAKMSIDFERGDGHDGRDDGHGHGHGHGHGGPGSFTELTSRGDSITIEQVDSHASSQKVVTP
ncbi:hypothetical protein GGR50DRAFT_690546 [Xylaria sp. CBS 124048]|nr:hypothetical protein GGR50DRAFT_690546 [Xylaria sp. CBS 124048]